VLTPFRLELPREVYDGIIAQAIAERPNECCGLLAGVLLEGVGRVVRRFPLVNEAASPTRYTAEAASLCAASRDCREADLEFLAIYHSHPDTEPRPSRTDLVEWYWDGVMCLIITLAVDPPLMRGWWLSNVDYCEADWIIR
jgi:proteasome lid subunit RPN8/RPN11